MIIIANKNQIKIRLDIFLKEKLSFLSRNQIQILIKVGKILINNNIIKKNNYIIKPLDIIDVNINSYDLKKNKNLSNEYNDIIAKKININIIYEDDDIILINKPHGLVVHPGCGNETKTLIHGIKYYYDYIFSNNVYRGGLVHRLDKDTSGLLIIAKNNISYKFLCKQFLYKTIKREYIALIWGDVSNKKKIIEGFIRRDPNNRKKMINSNINKIGKYSVTHYKILEIFGKYITLVLCNLETGRTHQIRVHFKYLGNPIICDTTYGKDEHFIKKLPNKYKSFFKNCLYKLSRQALHAISISFIHPNGKKYYFSCPISKDINIILNEFRNKFL
ncbi:RluA family pseudouridine synthase [Blattabacterium cuenoti]|uniref:RluA family pseudouridine synthase n=1 Tax=Blattabacterium cuenoti TaxID=1653831 RepID=UPI00163BCFE1|nr:RluA family pseudouridine synthase [Blattabacterium cuenoti]